MLKYIRILLLLLGLSGCLNPADKVESYNFYYWKSKFHIGSAEQNYLDQLGTKKLYIRLFDVDQADNGFPQPVGTLQGLDTGEIAQELIPVVYIANRSFNGLSMAEVDTLAKRVYTRIKHLFTQSGITSIPEIQIDCDWTPGTRLAYFAFLTHLKTYSNAAVTCTLRLHQVKYRSDTGIPPVDKVYLMCYATSSPLEKDPKNSILDLALLKDYLEEINTYPLQFDIALPLYSWAIVRNHLGEVRLINGVSAHDLETPSYQRLENGQYLVREDVFLQGMYLNKGFHVKIESISPDLLAQVQHYLQDHIQHGYNLVYFHLDEQFLRRFAITELKY